MPDDPLKEAIVGLQYDALVPKPYIKVILIQTTLVLLTNHSQHPYGIPQPLPDPVTEVIGHVHFHGEEEGLCILDGATMVAIHPALLGGALGHQGVHGDGSRLHKPRVHDLTLVVPLQGMEHVNCRYFAQRVR